VEKAHTMPVVRGEKTIKVTGRKLPGGVVQGPSVKAKGREEANIKIICRKGGAGCETERMTGRNKDGG